MISRPVYSVKPFTGAGTCCFWSSAFVYGGVSKCTKKNSVTSFVVSAKGSNIRHHAHLVPHC